MGGGVHFIDFYIRRVRRIFPSLILVLSAAFSIGWFVLTPDEYKQLGIYIFGGAIFIDNFIAWNESGYFDNASELKPLLHLWSLGIEEQFYIFWPLLLWISWKRGLNLFAVMALIISVSFLLNINGVNQKPTMTFYSPLTRVWEILSGGVLAYLQLYQKTKIDTALGAVNIVFSRLGFLKLWQYQQLTNIASLTGVIFLLFAVIFFSKQTSYPGIAALIPVLGSILIISAGRNAWCNSILLSNSLIVWFGLISYPLYLWHWTLLSFSRVIEGGEPEILIKIFVIALAIGLSWISYKVIENPIRFGEYSRTKSIVLMVLLAIIGYIGLNTYLRDGLDFRFKSYKHQVKQFGWDDSKLDETCIKKYLKNEKNIEFCRIQKDEEPTIILIGDSIAFQHFFGLVNESILANDSENILSINQGACGSLLGYSSRSDYERCEFVTKKALDIATNSNSIHTVILSMHPEYFYENTKKPLDFGLGVTPSGNLASQEAFEKYSKKVFRKLLEKLIKNGKQIIFVSHPPMLNYDPKNCITISRFRKAQMPICAMPRNVHNEHKSGYINLVNEVLKEFPEVKVFDLANMLCDTEKCWGMKNDVMLYRDGAHLSVDGSDYVAKNLYPMIHGH